MVIKVKLMSLFELETIPKVNLMCRLCHPTSKDQFLSSTQCLQEHPNQRIAKVFKVSPLHQITLITFVTSTITIKHCKKLEYSLKCLVEYW